MNSKLKTFSTSFAYLEISAFRLVHEYLRQRGLPIKDAVKDALIAFHYAEASKTKGAIDLCRTILNRKLMDLDALEQRLNQKNVSVLSSSDLQPVNISTDQLEPFEDNF